MHGLGGIDLNADLGEGAGFDAELMLLVTSANVCCGLHAGEPATSRETLELARLNGVAVKNLKVAEFEATLRANLDSAKK